MSIWLLLACAGAPAEPSAPVPVPVPVTAPASIPAAPPTTSTAGSVGLPEARPLDGVCEASAIVWDGARFIVADNEQKKRLYIYDAALRPTGELPLSEKIEDIEALTLLADGSLLIVGSQSNNSKGVNQPERQRLGQWSAGQLRTWTPDFGACAPCEAARALPPESGGLNVEGAARLGEAVWLGLRSPLVDGKALLLRMSADLGRAEQVVRVDLGGRGVRDLIAVDSGLLVVAGPADGAEQKHRLFTVDPRQASGEARLLDQRLPPSTEGLVRGADGRLVFLTDGAEGEPPSGPCRQPSTWGHLLILP